MGLLVLVRFLRRAGAQRHPVEGPAGAQGEGSQGNVMRPFSSEALLLPAPGPHLTGDRILEGTCRRTAAAGGGRCESGGAQSQVESFDGWENRGGEGTRATHRSVRALPRRFINR